jgi:transglutaminase superfamily protein/coenzyme PQQ synthesis protein D (PqqD)
MPSKYRVGTLCRAPHVVATTGLDRMVLLDTRHERYHALNEVASSVWRRIDGGTTFDAVVQGLIDEYEPPASVGREGVATDVERLLAQLDTDGLLADSTDECQPLSPPVGFNGHSKIPQTDLPDEVQPVVRMGTVLRYVMLIMLAKVSLRLWGVDRTVRRILRRGPSREEAAAVDWQVYVTTEYMVAMAAAIYPGRAECLERSLVLFRVLRGQGLSATLKLGVHPDPFVAHAWVESDNVAVSDNADDLAHYSVIREFR